MLDDRPALDGTYPHLDAARAAAVVCIAPCTANTLAKLGLGPRRQRRHAERALDAGAAARGAGDERAHVGAPGHAGQCRRGCASGASRSSGPAAGALAEGEEGMGRMAEPAEIVAAIEALLAPRAAARWPAGACSSRRAARASRSTACASSATARPGRMGAALAAEASARGAEVVTLLANASVRPEAGVCSRGRDYRGARARGARPRRLGRRGADGGGGRRLPAGRQLEAGKRERGGAWSLELEPTADVLAALAARRRPGQVLVGFAAEDGADVERAEAKRRAQGRRPDRAQRRVAQPTSASTSTQRGRAGRRATASTQRAARAQARDRGAPCSTASSSSCGLSGEPARPGVR